MPTETEPLMISIQVPKRLHKLLKQEALKRDMKLKDLVAAWLESGIGKGVLKAKGGK